MKFFELPRAALIWLGMGTVFWFVIGIITLNGQEPAWKGILLFALAAACLVGVVLGTIARKRNVRD
ncbi:hypothetical protein ACSBOX_05960 [Arthrobacter sp. KN11-1C]|uniref:hypothetical protein n=1 Tax=Arthrobacter sp. KN11-1C TaxID=3445774 RepID=UPI003FA1691D